MANKKITELTALVTPASTDVLAIVDVAGAETKKITVANLTAGGGGILTQVETAVDNTSVSHMKYDDDPVELVAAQLGKIIVPVNFTIVATAAGLAEASSDDLRFGWDAANSGASDYINSSKDYMNGISSGVVTTTILSPINTAFITSYPFSAVNKPLQAWCSGVFDGGWSMTIYTTYYTITV